MYKNLMIDKKTYDLIAKQSELKNTSKAQVIRIAMTYMVDVENTTPKKFWDSLKFKASGKKIKKVRLTRDDYEPF